jgi:hypothetical protein
MKDEDRECVVTTEYEEAFQTAVSLVTPACNIISHQETADSRYRQGDELDEG